MKELMKMEYYNMNIDKITQKLKEYFGAERLPNPHNYPQSYMWYVEMYRYRMSEKKNAKV